jgi:hypothetical protein
MANDLDDLDGAEGGPQPAEGRELVIVDLGHSTIMPPSWPGIGPLSWPALLGAFAEYGLMVAAPQRSGRIFLAGEMTGCCGAECR